jgi:hypothetical protein
LSKRHHLKEKGGCQFFPANRKWPRDVIRLRKKDMFICFALSRKKKSNFYLPKVEEFLSYWKGQVSLETTRGAKLEIKYCCHKRKGTICWISHKKTTSILTFCQFIHVIFPHKEWVFCPILSIFVPKSEQFCQISVDTKDCPR